MGMHKLFNDDYSSRVDTSTQAELNNFGVVEGLQTLPKESAMVRECATPYAQGVKIPSHSGEAEVIKASCQAATALLPNLFEYLEKRSKDYVRCENFEAAVAVDGIRFWLKNELTKEQL